MTVKELIEKLSGMNPDLPVSVAEGDDLSTLLQGVLIEGENRPYKASHKRGDYVAGEHVVLVSY